MNKPASDYASQFAKISNILIQHYALWSTKPFKNIPPSWAVTNPALANWLISLDDEQYKYHAANVEALNEAVTSFIPGVNQLQLMSKLKRFDTGTSSSQLDYINTGIAGRKWQQICDFSASLNNINSPIVEWCAGKSHLGRLLSLQFSQTTTALEINQSICQSGRQHALRDKANVTHINCNVLEEGASHISQNNSVVALHACGDLHTHLLKVASTKKPNTLAIAPCCYQLTQHEHKVWLSNAGQKSHLNLTKDDLRIALMDTVVAGKRNIRIRDTFNQWRLGFDEIQRVSRNTNHYLPVPPLPEKLLKGTFKEFCQYVALLKNVAIKDPIDYKHYEKLGAQRYKKTQRYSLVRYIFRRPLEVLLNLDYCLFLEQHNYSVQLGEFSDYKTTPRNIMLLAETIKG